MLDKLNYLTRDKVPGLISRIHQVNKDIALSKVELFKLKLSKENPDWQPENAETGIVGTGINGEITDADRQKFKSKQLLKQRMAALTGKSYESGNELDVKLQQEIKKTQSEGENQSGMIRDIEASIKELEDGCATNLQITNKEEVDTDKWENGNNLNGEVAKFIRELNSSEPKQQPGPQVTSSVDQRQSAPKDAEASVVSPQLTGASDSSTASHEYRTPEERSAYIKAQAEKRMNERLAKLGLTRHKTSSSSYTSEPQAHGRAPLNANPEPPKAPEGIVHTQPQQLQPRDTQEETKTQGKGIGRQNDSSKQVNQTPNQSLENDSDDDNEEYEALMKQKEEMEARERERKLKKKQEKEARLEKLKREMEELKKKEEAGYSSDEEPVTEVKSYGPGGSIHKTTTHDATSDPVIEQKTNKEQSSTPTVQTENFAPKTHDNNPFAKLQNSSIPESNNGSKDSLFFKPEKDVTIDPKKSSCSESLTKRFG